ncbi:peptidoglycan DD-metalloendopeptidase family protein [Dermatophilaceae bacterium Soc4.6]
MTRLLSVIAMMLAVAIPVPLLAAAFVVSAAAAVTPAPDCTPTGSTSATGAAGAGVWRVPFQQAYVLTSPFGRRVDPLTGVTRLHTGQDLASLPGPGPVLAAAAGTATTGWDPVGYGHYVTIDHGGGIQTLYGHLSSIAADLLVGPIITTTTTTGAMRGSASTAGVVVGAGQAIGVEGSTGHSTGDHLHFEVRIHGAPLDPVPFMLEHGAPLNGAAGPPASRPDTGSPRPADPAGTGSSSSSYGPAGAGGSGGKDGGRTGGPGFPLPAAGTPRLESLTSPALPIPAGIKADYLAAAARYHLPWTLLAGIGMEETGHDRTRATSPAGAQGLMQFMPATWAVYGVDGNGDGRADIGNDADSAMSAAHYLTAAGATTGPAGVRHAIFTYNHADWYVNDVLAYAAAYGGGLIPTNPNTCRPGS